MGCVRLSSCGNFLPSHIDRHIRRLVLCGSSIPFKGGVEGVDLDRIIITITHTKYLVLYSLDHWLASGNMTWFWRAPHWEKGQIPEDLWETVYYVILKTVEHLQQPAAVGSCRWGRSWKGGLFFSSQSLLVSTMISLLVSTMTVASGLHHATYHMLPNSRRRKSCRETTFGWSW